MAQRFNNTIKHSGGAKIFVFADTLIQESILGHRYGIAVRAKNTVPADTWIRVHLAGIMWEGFGRQGYAEEITPAAADIFPTAPSDANHTSLDEDDVTGEHLILGRAIVGPGAAQRGYHSDNNPSILIAAANRVGLYVASYTTEGGNVAKDDHDEVEMEVVAVIS